MGRIAGTGAILALLAACQAGDRLTPENVGPPPPPGTPQVKQAVDGLVVGRRLMAANQYELALQAFYRAALDHGLSVEVLTAIGSANLKLGRLSQAENDFRAALHRDPGSVPALNNLGVLLMEQGKYAEARQIFRRAFALDSGDSDVIRENLKHAIALMNKSGYSPPQEVSSFRLVARGDGTYLLQSTK